MAEPDFTIRQGDTASALEDTLRDAAGDPANLTGASVDLSLVPLEGGDAIIDNEDADIVDPDAGTVKRDWQAGETDDPGFYLGSWKVTFSGGDVQTYPNSGFFLVHISEHASGALGAAYITLEDFKDTLTLNGLSYADKDAQRSILAASRVVDHKTGRRFYPGADGEIRYYTPKLEGELWIDDLLELDTLKTAPSSDGLFTQTWVDGTDYRLEPLNAPTDGRPWDKIRLLTGSTYQLPLGYIRSVEVTGKFGWLTPPDEIVQATALIATQLLRRVREAPFGVIGIGLEGEAIRLSKTDPQLADLLGPFRKRRTVLA